MIEREQSRTGFGRTRLDEVYPATVSEADKLAVIRAEARHLDDYDLDTAWWIEPEPEDAA